MAETLAPTGTAGLAGRHDRAQWRARVTREAYAADVDEYRQRYGKAEGERRFFAENAPTDASEHEDNMLLTAGITAIWNALTQGTAGAFQNATAAIGVGDGNLSAALTGTASVTNGSTAVTFTSSQSLTVGDYLVFVGDSTNGVYKIASGATTSWTLASGYGGSTASGLTAKTVVGEVASQTNLQAATNAFRQAMDATFPTVSGATVTFKSTFGTANANFAWYEWSVFSSVGSGSPPTGGTALNRKVQSSGSKTSAASWAFTITVTLS